MNEFQKRKNKRERERDEKIWRDKEIKSVDNVKEFYE